MKTWDGGDLTGEWLFTYKIDGVRALKKDGKWYSRAGKELYNIPDVPYDDVEVYLGNWNDTVSAVRTKTFVAIPEDCIYSLNPIDHRLIRFMSPNPNSESIKVNLKIALEIGYEGLVLYQGDKVLKVKPIDTVDVRVCHLIEGKGKYTNMLGAVITPYGKVGTGFTDNDRAYFWLNKEEILDQIIEVSYMELTRDGKFRHPRFIRLREDKDTATHTPRIENNSPAGL